MNKELKNIRIGDTKKGFSYFGFQSGGVVCMIFQYCLNFYYFENAI